MFAAHVCAVVRRVVVDELDVCGQSYTRIGAFDQVVAEQRVAWKSPIKYRVQRLHFIDPFSREDTLSKKILIGIGDGAGVKIEAALAGVDRRQS